MGGLADDRCLVPCAADGSGRKVYLICVVSIFVATAVRLSRDVGAVSSSSRSSMPSAAGDEALVKAVRAAALALTLAFTLTYDRLLISGSRVPGQSVWSSSLLVRFRSFWASVGDRSTWPAWSASSRFPCGRRARRGHLQSAHGGYHPALGRRRCLEPHGPIVSPWGLGACHMRACS